MPPEGYVLFQLTYKYFAPNSNFLSPEEINKKANFNIEKEKLSTT